MDAQQGGSQVRTGSIVRLRAILPPHIRRQHLVRVDLPTYWIANGTCHVLDIAMCPINVPIKNMATNSRIDINATVGASISDRVSAAIPLLTLNGLQSEVYRAAHSSVSGINLVRRDHDPGRPAL